MNPDELHLKEYTAELERLKIQDPEFHIKAAPGLIDTPKNILAYRIDAVIRMIEYTKERLL